MSGSKSFPASLAAAGSHPHHPGNDTPLALTVHNLPQAGDAMAAARRSAHGRWKMAAVLLVCAAPVLASYWAYYMVRPEGRRNYGELIQPQRPMLDLTATYFDGRSTNLAELKNQWLLVSVGGGACNAPCQNHLYLQRQLRESLGKEKERLDWVWLVNDGASPPFAIGAALQKATVLRVQPQALAQWLEPARGQALADHLYVVDPMGNWMMRFPAHMDAAGAAKAKRDVERLLRASSAWDQAGRPGRP